MPIPKPKKDESKEDYLPRCMANPTMNEEYEDDKQRAAICSAQFSVNFASNVKTYDKEVEIFAVGTWNGMQFTAEDLMDFANSFHSLKEVHKVPLKMGHNDSQPFTDGQPALGWVDDVYFNKEAGKLIAKFIEMPEVVYNAMEAGLYKHVSIEADFGVEHNGSFYSNVLSGVALLGADIPAVNTLQDLQAFMSKENAGEYKFSKRQCFNYQKGVDNMPTDLETKLQADLDAEKAKNVKFSADNDKLTADALEAGNVAKKAAFSREKAGVEADLESLVKDNKITPAQRDNFNDINETNIESIKFSINVLKENGKAVDDKENGSGNNADNGSGYKDPIAELDKRAKKFSRENKTNYKDAVHAVMEDDEELARDYLNVTGS